MLPRFGLLPALSWHMPAAAKGTTMKCKDCLLDAEWIITINQESVYVCDSHSEERIAQLSSQRGIEWVEVNVDVDWVGADGRGLIQGLMDKLHGNSQDKDRT